MSEELEDLMKLYSPHGIRDYADLLNAAHETVMEHVQADYDAGFGSPGDRPVSHQLRTAMDQIGRGLKRLDQRSLAAASIARGLVMLLQIEGVQRVREFTAHHNRES